MIASRTLATPKLRERTDTLDRRFDELAATLGAAIGEIEAGALEPTLEAWLEWVKERKQTHSLQLAVRASRPNELPLVPGCTFIAVSDLAVAGDPVALGTLRRDCAGLAWLYDAAVPPALNDAFAESPLGVCVIAPTALDPWSSMLPEATPAAAAALLYAGALLDLAALVAAKHTEENARLSMQGALAERSRGSRSVLEELIARRDSLIELRDDIQRDLQVVVEDADKFVDDIDTEALFRGGVRKALEAIPALNVRADRLVSKKTFNQESRFHWWTGSPWQRLRFLFDHKKRLTIPTAELMTLSSTMIEQAKSIVSRQAQRRLDRFDAAMDDFADTAGSLGVDLRAAKVKPEARIRWVQRNKSSAPNQPPSGRGERSRNMLEERCRRVVDVVRERDLHGFHVDMIDRGPIGRITEARTAVFGLLSLVTFFLSKTPAVIGSFAGGTTQINTTVVAAQIAFGFLFFGFIVSAITGRGKEDAIVSEKVNDARDALEDKLVTAMGRFVSDEIDSVKSLLIEGKADVIGRMERAVEAIKQECEELERRRPTIMLRTSRLTLAPLPVTLRSDVDKVRQAMRDLRAELAANLVPRP